MENQGARWIIHTDVATDGAMKGPNLSAQEKMAAVVPNCKVIASGGVSSKEDIEDLRNLALKFENLEGVIVGKALYEKTVSLREVIS